MTDTPIIDTAIKTGRSSNFARLTRLLGTNRHHKPAPAPARIPL